MNTTVPRRLGPLPGRARTYNQTTLTAGAQHAFLTAAQDEQARRTGTVSSNRTPAAPKAESWYRFENLASPDPELYLYGEIGCWGITASDLISELQYVTAPALTVHLSSPGGEIFEGIAVYNALRSHPAAITIRVDSIAASIASVILQAGDTRVMQPFSQAMIHEGSGLCWGNAAEMVAMATLLDKQSDNIAAVYAERAGGTPESWRELMRAESWFTADEAVAAGLADEVDAPEPTTSEPTPAATPAPAAMWDLSAYRHAGREDAPAPILNTAPVEAEPAGDQPPPAAVEPTNQAADPTPETTGQPAEPAAVEPPIVEPVTAELEPAEPAPRDAWADMAAQLLTAPTWDDVTASLREASK